MLGSNLLKNTQYKHGTLLFFMCTTVTNKLNNSIEISHQLRSFERIFLFSAQDSNMRIFLQVLIILWIVLNAKLRMRNVASSCLAIPLRKE